MIAKGKDNITVEDLIEFLRKHGPSPRQGEIEAILRRCDHEGNQKLNYQEFCEATSCNEDNLS